MSEEVPSRKLAKIIPQKRISRKEKRKKIKVNQSNYSDEKSLLQIEIHNSYSLSRIKNIVEQAISGGG
jgi:hypothetical protein